MNGGIDSSGDKYSPQGTGVSKKQPFRGTRKKISQMRRTLLVRIGREVKETKAQASVKEFHSEFGIESSSDISGRRTESHEPVIPQVKPPQKERKLLRFIKAKPKPVPAEPLDSPPPKSAMQPLPKSALPFVGSHQLPDKLVNNGEHRRSSSISDDGTVETFGADFSNLDSNTDIDEVLNHPGFEHQSGSPKNLNAKRNLAEKVIGWVAEKALKKYLPVDSYESSHYKEKIAELEEKIKQAGKARKMQSKLHKEHEKTKKRTDSRLKDIKDKHSELQGDIVRNQQKLRDAEQKDPSSDQAQHYRNKIAQLQTQNDKFMRTLEEAEDEVRMAAQALAADDEVTDRRSDVETQLELQKQAYEHNLALAKENQDIFNRQLVSLVLSLRRVHQGKTSLPQLKVSRLKIPFEDDFLELSNVTFNPTGIVTRHENGHPFVDIELSDVEASVLAPIDGGVKADVRLSITPIKLTLGGPIGGAFQKYLDCKKKDLAPAMGQLAKAMISAATGDKEDAPVHVSADIGKVSVETEGTTAETITRGLNMARRSPDSVLHKALAQLRLPVNVHVHQLDVDTHGEVDLTVAVKNLNVALNPDLKGEMSETSRMASLGVKVGSIHVDATGPVALASKAVGQLLPPDPLQVLEKTPVSKGFLEKLPPDACHTVSGYIGDLKVDLVQNVNKRTTRLSPEKAVWRTEGDSSTHVEVGRLDLKTKGNLEVSGGVSGISIDINRTGTSQDEVCLSVGQKDQGNSGLVTVTCKPAFMKNLVAAMDENTEELRTKEKKGPLDNLLIDGAATIVMEGRTGVVYDRLTGKSRVDIDGLKGDTLKSALVLTEDVRLQLPKDVAGQIRDVYVTSEPVKHRNVKENKTTVDLGRINLEGHGDIVVDTGMENPLWPRHHFSFPLNGKGHLCGVKVVMTEMPETDKGRNTKKVVLAHETLRASIENVSSGRMKVGGLGLMLDHNLNGHLTVKGASIGFNDLVNDQVSFNVRAMQDEEERSFEHLQEREGQLFAAQQAKENREALHQELVGPTPGVQIRNSLPMPAFVKKLFRNKTLNVSGDIVVSNGALHLSKLRKLKVNVKADPQSGLGNRIMASVLNTGVRVVLYFMSNIAFAIGQENGRPVVRSPLLGNARIPLPAVLEQNLIVDGAGALNIAAMQNLATGLYCFPRSTQQELDSLLAKVYEKGQSTIALDQLLGRVEECMKNQARLQEALYLLNSLHVDSLVKEAREPGNESMMSQLRRAAHDALQHPATQGLALYIYNAGFSVLAPISPELLESFEECADATGMQAMNLAEILWKSGRISRAVPVLKRIAEKDSSHVEARLLLACYFWDSNDHLDAMFALKDAAVAGGTETTNKVLNLLDNYAAEIAREDDQAVRELVTRQLRLLQGALALRTEVKGGDSSGFLRAVDRLENLAVTDEDARDDAVEILKDRCDHAYHIQEELELEEWEVWNDKMTRAVERIGSGKPVDMEPKEAYMGALSLMYCFKGINQNLQAAQVLFESIDPQTPEIRMHLGIIERVQAERKTQLQQDTSEI
ncbi:tetratricopeptide repeat protein [Sansalvadorimonas verongulae]|uniref:tetratricopeptide repeat protein n=1 Tax=Sansalvadorimonas verongulae TaxID=2172824 RepID=UPI0012BBA4C2|nr:hypothetical protein [Sansalvadorimonas verongulae]MTI14344.1 hypothetical protein [Sansalvadorimonas verongulae]